VENSRPEKDVRSGFCRRDGGLTGFLVLKIRNRHWAGSLYGDRLERLETPLRRVEGLSSLLSVGLELGFSISSNKTYTPPGAPAVGPMLLTIPEGESSVPNIPSESLGDAARRKKYENSPPESQVLGFGALTVLLEMLNPSSIAVR
jgi:hypothetical protein